MAEYKNGLNNFDVIYYINLDHREDRNQHINEELSKTNIDKCKINRIPGVYVKGFGALGCSKSHCIALETFLNSPETNQTCIIFEDDFEFTQNQTEINNLINKSFNELKEFDVLMLSSNILNYASTQCDFLNKILLAQTLSGYAVSRQYASTLLQNFKKGASCLEMCGHSVHEFCIDIYMQQLQPSGRWYCLNPKIGQQMNTFSDIENRVVQYNC
jgi:GR25 family glycosyltransferase involved in LPS biosynthesis